MIDVIVGPKGSGKSSGLVEEIIQKAQKEENIVCIEHGKRFDRQIPYQVRLIDVTEYPVANYDQLLAFLAGISAKDYDISHVYIDSIYKIAGTEDTSELSKFFDNLKAFTEQLKINFTITISDDLDKMPENVKACAR